MVTKESQSQDCCGVICSDTSGSYNEKRAFVGKKAPDFTAAAVMEDGIIDELFSFYNYLNEAYGVLFFYPMDFTFVCPSEILAFSNRVVEFKKRNTKVVGVSTDSHFVHTAWREILPEKGGIGSINFPLVADMRHDIAKSYGVLIQEQGIALRGTFVIDRSGVIRHITINDLPLGRSVDETLRIIDSLKHVEEYGEVCPAGWQKGQEAMKPNAKGVASYLKNNKDIL